MPITEKTVLVYLDQAGRAPFTLWLASLRDRAAVAKIRVRLARVRLGNLGDHHSVGEGVVELSVDFGPGYRVYLGQEGDAIVVLLCGGDKSRQSQDIKTAQERWLDYRRRCDEENKSKLS